MKILLTVLLSTTLLLSVLIINFTPDLKSDFIVKEKVVFDGKEGNLFFFTDYSEKSITIEDNLNVLFKSLHSDANSYIGKTFNLTLQASAAESQVYSAKAVVRVELVD